MQAVSVSALNEQIKTLLEESFNRVFVEGELSRITYHNSGHIYFTLKDNSSAISCVMFRGNATRLKFNLEEGLKVLIDGAITLYKPRGSYQINCFSIEPSGQGALALAFEQLKQELSQKGYFDQSRKKQLPKFPKKIALITSATSAALQDMLRVANNRYRNLEIDIYDTLVQGDNASKSIADAIFRADQNGYDILIVGRGGGSIEDLWAFNEKIVADAIFNAKTPIVSAVGHEIDTLISDFVADLRAPTPSAAMEMILPDSNELLLYLDSLFDQYSKTIEQKISKKELEIKHLENLFAQNSIERKLTLKLEEVSRLKDRFFEHIDFKFNALSKDLSLLNQELPHKIYNIINTKSNRLENLKSMFESNNPSLKQKKGFVQISKNRKIIDLTELKKDDVFELQDFKTVINAKVL